MIKRHLMYMVGYDYQTCNQKSKYVNDTSKTIKYQKVND